MAKTKTANPEMEGGVSRAVDFNLKKEDLMLLILEGRKEQMEEQIASIQQTSISLMDVYRKQNDKLYKKILEACKKTINAEAKKLDKTFGQNGMADLDLDEDYDTENGENKFGKSMRVDLSRSHSDHEYSIFMSAPIGGEGSKGSTYIKSTRTKSFSIALPSRFAVTIEITPGGKVFANNDPIFFHETVKPCREYGHKFTLVDESLNMETIRKTDEYKEMMETVKSYCHNENLLSDILAEYDLFNRNQTRAKAKMIKEVLGRDEAGQALLGNIMTAASGVKLIGAK